MALPTSSSLAPRPYISDVSRNVTPSSIARWMVAIDSAWVRLPFPPTGAGGRYRAPTKFGTASNHEEGAEC